jgi:hypothetical protein
MKRKREYLEALDKGEEPPYNPFEFDKDTLQYVYSSDDIRLPSHRARHKM